MDDERDDSRRSPQRPEEKVSREEMTRRTEDWDEEGTGPGSSETVEPVGGREDDGPSGPPQRDLGKE